MSRIDDIKAYKIKQEKNKQIEEDKKRNEIQILTERVRQLQPRIAELIETANACLESGIEIDAYGKTFYRSVDDYTKGSFITNSITHKVGFVKAWRGNQGNSIKKIYEMGINAGGACGHLDFRTDGIKVYSVNEDDQTHMEDPLEKHLNQFLKNFDLFETEFYKYIDAIIGE